MAISFSERCRGPTVMSQRWYYQMLGEEFGPVTEPQLRLLLEEGTLSDKDSVRHEAYHEWLSISEAFSGVLVETTDEIADLSELAFSFEDSGSTARRRTYSTETSPGVISAEPITHGQTPAESVPAPESSSLYYCQALGQTMGPIPIAALVGMAETGSLSKSDPVRFGANGDWFLAGELAEVAATLMLVDRITPAPATVASEAPHRLEMVAAAELMPAPEKINYPVETPTTPSRTSEQKGAGSETSSRTVRERQVRKKGSQKKERKREDALLSDIFDEVFAEEEKPVRLSPSVYSAASSASVASPVESPGPATAPSPLMSASAAASAVRSSSGPTLSARRSRSDTSLPMPGKGVVIAVVLFAAAVGYIYQFGMPSLSFKTASRDEYPARLKAAMEAYKTLGDTPTEGNWKIFCDNTRAEFMTYYTNLRDGGMSGPKDKVSMSAIKTLIDLTATGFNQKDYRDKQFAKLEKLMLELNK